MNLHQLKQYYANNKTHGEAIRYHFGELTQAINAPLLMPAPGKKWGIDISHWNIPPVNLKKMRDEFGLSFLFIKGCDGTLVSRYAYDHIKTAIEAGLPFGLYNWLYRNMNVSIEAQTTAWAKMYQEVKPPLGSVIDCEWTKYAGVWSNPTSADLNMAHDRFAAKSLSHAMTYTSPGYAKEYLQGFDFSRKPLWTAQYLVDKPDMPGWKYWQFGILDGRKLDPNGNYEIDGNYEAEASTGETTMDTYGRVKTVTNIREGAGVSWDVIGQMQTGDLVTASEIRPVGSYFWWKIIAWTRNGVAMTLPLSATGEHWAYGTNIEKLPAPPVTSASSLEMVLPSGTIVTVKDASGNIMWSGKA